MKNEIQNKMNRLEIKQHNKYPNRVTGTANQSSAPAESNSPLQGVGGEIRQNKTK